MGRGYSGNHPRYSDERYDAKQAYNKDLTASARLHYLENDRHDHESPAHMSVNERLDDSFGLGQNSDKTPSPMNSHCSPMHAHDRSHRLRQRAINISERSGAERGDEYDYENPKVMKMLNKANKLDERSSKPMNASIKRFVVSKPNEYDNEKRQREVDSMIDERGDSPMNACAKSEGGKGCVQQISGSWRVISNKTDKPWPAKYANKSKAEAALRGYHAG